MTLPSAQTAKRCFEVLGTAVSGLVLGSAGAYLLGLGFFTLEKNFLDWYEPWDLPPWLWGTIDWLYGWALDSAWPPPYFCTY